jgi:hypothetical protein
MNRLRIVQVLAILVIAFGALTLFSGGQALFGSPEARAAVGNAVPFVLWFNFSADFVYILAGVGLLSLSTTRQQEPQNFPIWRLLVLRLRYAAKIKKHGHSA